MTEGAGAIFVDFDTAESVERGGVEGVEVDIAWIPEAELAKKGDEWRLDDMDFFGALCRLVYNYDAAREVVFCFRQREEIIHSAIALEPSPIEAFLQRAGGNRPDTIISIAEAVLNN